MYYVSNFDLIQILNIELYKKLQTQIKTIIYCIVPRLETKHAILRTDYVIKSNHIINYDIYLKSKF